MNAAINVYALDFSLIQKGDVIDRVQIERFTGYRKSVDETRFRFALRDLKHDIEAARKDLYLRCRLDSLIVLTDEQAEHYNIERVEQSVQGLGVLVKRRTRIDRREFNAGQLRAAESRDRSYAGIAQAARRALAKAEHEASLLVPPDDKD